LTVHKIEIKFAEMSLTGNCKTSRTILFLKISALLAKHFRHKGSCTIKLITGVTTLSVATLSTTTLSITTLRINPLSIMTLYGKECYANAKTLSTMTITITTFSIMTLGIKG
jgi:hypothetical protein